MNRESPNYISRLERLVSTLKIELDTANKRLRDETRVKKRSVSEHKTDGDFLEQAVKERTSELTKTNKALRAEIMRRIQMGKELAESHRFVNRIADATPDILYIYDVITGRNIYVNRRVSTILGFSRDQIKEMGGAFFQTLLHPDDSRVFQSARTELLKSGDKDFIEKEYRMKNARGDWRWFSSRIVVFRKTPDGGPHLVLGIAQDITDRKAADEELSRSRQQLRLLLAHLQSIREEERTRISREIHDELGQSLTALKIDLSWLQKRIGTDQAELIEKTRRMQEIVDLNLQTVKRISSELRPGLLDNLGLTAALEWQVDDFQKRTSVQCRLSITSGLKDPGKDISTAVFRITQEALTNVARHAAASEVSLDLTKKTNYILLRISDNGIGISLKQASSPMSIGLTGMKERVDFLGGKFSISGKKNKGTTLTVKIPLDKNTVRQARKC